MSSNLPTLTAAEALARLLEGNRRFAAAKTLHPHQDATRRSEVLAGQNPFAVILTCSDSRVPPEILFDQGIGDLFVIRTAGNVVDKVGLGSIEYAVAHLGVRLVVVLGHQHCGAVKAACADGEAEGHIASIVKIIQTSVEKARESEAVEDLPAAVVDLNARHVADRLRENEPVLQPLAAAGQVSIIAARYDLDTGNVVLLD